MQASPSIRSLRTGFTTGYCAAQATRAATTELLSSGRDVAVCSVVKDAGDDPDVTHGVEIFATVSRTAGSIEIDGGEGIGRVTKPGLKVAVGKAAINPVPMEMITAAIEEVLASHAYTGGIKAVISIPGGAEIAKKTLNERLGVLGGLSILGTTGIVEPMSNRAVVETIQAEIDVQTASGNKSLLVTPGNYGRSYAAEELGVNIEEAIKCSNFIGETLDHACAKGVEHITLIGHAGKLVKLAGGIMNTHSNMADCRMEIIAAHCALAGAETGLIEQIMACVTTEAAIELMKQAGVNDAVWESIGQKIGFHLRERTRGSVRVEYIVFTQEHGVLCEGATA
jgi:cobalt-precorrin-5B (C1)-methyltransferase